MKTLINTLCSTKHSALFISALFLSNSVMAQQIAFNIKGVNSNNGKLYVQLFSGEQAYNSENPVAATIVKAKIGDSRITFNDVDPGEYALRFYHDENDNGELETNLLGLPTEGYGFSNDAKPNFGPVSYQAIKFTVTAQDTLVINDTSVIY